MNKHIAPTKGITNLRQPSRLNEAQVLSNTYLLRYKCELNYKILIHEL